MKDQGKAKGLVVATIPYEKSTEPTLNTMKSMTRKELAQLAGVSERTLRRWLHSNHNQLIAAGYQASQRKLPPRVVKYLMEFYGIER